MSITITTATALWTAHREEAQGVREVEGLRRGPTGRDVSILVDLIDVNDNFNEHVYKYSL